MSEFVVSWVGQDGTVGPSVRPSVHPRLFLGNPFGKKNALGAQCVQPVLLGPAQKHRLYALRSQVESRSRGVYPGVQTETPVTALMHKWCPLGRLSLLSEAYMYIYLPTETLV